MKKIILGGLIVSAMFVAVGSDKKIQDYAALHAKAKTLMAQKDYKGARACYQMALAENLSLLDALRNLRQTYKNREEPKGFEVSIQEFEKYADKLSEKEKIQFWNEFADSAYYALSYENIRLAKNKLKALGQNEITAAKGRPERALAAYDEMLTFPKKESDIKFPNTLTDFDVAMTGKTVYVARDFGFDPVNATEFLQKALDSGASRVIVENMGKPWYIREVTLRSNTELIFQKGVKVHMDRTWEIFRTGYVVDALQSLFVIKNVENVIVKGENNNDTDVQISQFYNLMDRAKHCKTYGRSAFAVQNCKNVCIKNMRISDNSMDAILLDGHGMANRHVYIENCDLDSNFRQACSIVSANGAYFKNVKFRRTAGAEPLAGIDMEPALLTQSNAAIYFFDCEFDSNMGGGLLFSTSSYKPITVLVKRCVFKPQRRSDVIVFIRMGAYMGRNMKVPGKAIFEDCEFQGYSDVSPIKIESLFLLDIDFKNCVVKDTGKLLNRSMKPDASVVDVELNRDVYYSNIPDDNAQGTITFKNFTVEGYANAPFIQYFDDAGHYSVRNWKGTVDFNGKQIDVSQFARQGPDRGLTDLPNALPSHLATPVCAPSDKRVEHPFAFRYDVKWWMPSPDYTYLFYAKKGAYAEFLLRYVGWVPGDKTIRLMTPSGTELKLGEFKVGDNALCVTFPETGWYSFHPAARHILVTYKGVDLCYYAGTGKERKIQLDAPHGYTGYFEVPPKGEMTFKVHAGLVEIRNAKGELVSTVQSGVRTGSAYAKIKSDSGKTEVWSFTVPEKATFKFFLPATGVWSDRPEALPVRAKDVVRSPLVKIERKIEKEDDTAVQTKGIPFADYLKANPMIAKIVEKECAARIAWAKEGVYAKLYKDRKDFLDDFRLCADNEQAQREVHDMEKNLPPVKELGDMEEAILKMSKEELQRYAFCNAFIVFYGVYPDKEIGGNYIRCLAEGSQMAEKYPDVYWWIFTKNFEQFIAGYAAEMKLGYTDFTLTCDDDKKLTKLLPILQKYVSALMPKTAEAK